MELKRGALTSTQIIMIVLAVAGFVIILIFFSIIFQNDGTAQKLACEESVLVRATVPDAIQSGIPLNCRTEKLCVTNSLFGSCEQFTGEDVSEIRSGGNLDDLGDRLKIRTDIEEILANSMLDCWNMVGRGEWDIFGSAFEELGFDEQEASCIICSRIAFDESLVKSGVIGEVNLNSYLLSNNVGDTGKNYIEFFTNGETNAFPAQVDLDLLDTDTSYQDNSETFEGTSDGNQLAVVFAQNKPTGLGDVLTNWGVILLGKRVAGPSLKGVIPGSVRKYFLLVEGGIVAAAAVNTVSNQRAAALYCGDVVGTKDNLKKGCSLLQVVEYNPQDVNKLCTTIQSLP